LCAGNELAESVALKNLDHLLNKRSIGWMIGWIALIDWLVYGNSIGPGKSPDMR
jgi:hypothetical protein